MLLFHLRLQFLDWLWIRYYCYYRWRCNNEATMLWTKMVVLYDDSLYVLNRRSGRNWNKYTATRGSSWLCDCQRFDVHLFSKCYYDIRCFRWNETFDLFEYSIFICDIIIYDLFICDIIICDIIILDYNKTLWYIG